MVMFDFFGIFSVVDPPYNGSFQIVKQMIPSWILLSCDRTSHTARNTAVTISPQQAPFVWKQSTISMMTEAVWIVPEHDRLVASSTSAGYSAIRRTDWLHEISCRTFQRVVIKRSKQSVR